jgi:hypothetical protein
MKTIMNIDNLTQIEHLDAFLVGNQQIAYSVPGDKPERYRLIQKVLVKFDYLSCNKKDKGLISRFLIKLTGYSRQQLSRLIKQYRKTGYIKHTPARGNGFHQKYTQRDIRLLAKTDELHETPCGHAVKKINERCYQVYKEDQYQNLTTLSVSHLYNLRNSTTYQRQRTSFKKTKPRQIAIGERRKPPVQWTTRLSSY